MKRKIENTTSQSKVSQGIVVKDDLDELLCKFDPQTITTQILQ